MPKLFPKTDWTWRAEPFQPYGHADTRPVSDQVHERSSSIIRPRNRQAPLTMFIEQREERGRGKEAKEEGRGRIEGREEEDDEDGGGTLRIKILNGNLCQETLVMIQAFTSRYLVPASSCSIIPPPS